MLKIINQKFFLFTPLLFLCFLPLVEIEFIPIFIFNMFFGFAYILTINHSASLPEKSLNRKRLVVTVFSYSIFFVTVLNIISKEYTNNYFVFSEFDAIVYHIHSLKMASKSFVSSVEYFMNYNSYEDLGAVLVISTLYRLVESNLFVNFFYILTGVFTSLGIFSISQNLMCKSYAFYCSLAYSISSYVLWFHSSGLKESVVIMLIVLFFDQYYKFVRSSALFHIMFAITFCFPLLFFRPVLLLFCIGSAVLSTLLYRNQQKVFVIVSIFLLLSFSFIYPHIKEQTSEKYIPKGVEEMIDNRASEGMVKKSVPFTYAVNFLAATVGPLPTLVPKKKTVLFLYSSGLIYKIFISIMFFGGIYLSYRQKEVAVYPLILFALMEMGALIFILEGLELRKSLPHFPAVFIVSYWGLYVCDRKLVMDGRIKKKTVRAFNIVIVSLCLLIVTWNTRSF
jgi:hypothetical protein